MSIDSSQHLIVNEHDFGPRTLKNYSRLIIKHACLNYASKYKNRYQA